MKSTKAPIGSIQNVNQESQKFPMPNQSVTSSNAQNIMGKTVLNTVYPVQSQIPNQIFHFDFLAYFQTSNYSFNFFFHTSNV